METRFVKIQSTDKMIPDALRFVTDLSAGSIFKPG